MFVRTTRLLLVVSALTLSACPKKTKGPATVAELAESEANDPAKNFAKGLEALQQKGGANYDQAYGFFAKAESLSGKKTASFNAGWCAEQLGKPDVAEGHYRKALAADAAYAPAFDSLARVLKQLDKNDELVALYAKHLEGRGDDLVVVTPRRLRERTEARLRAVSQGGRLASWLGREQPTGPPPPDTTAG